MIRSPVGRLAVQLWVGTFVGLLGSYLVSSVTELRIPAILLYALPIAAWAALRLRGPRDPLDVAVLLAVAAHLAVSVLSADPAGSLEATGLALGYALLFWLMRDVGESPALRQAIALAVVVPMTAWLVAAAVAWVGEKVAWVAAGGGWPALESFQVFVWGSANAFPIMALLSAPFLAFVQPGRTRTAVVATFVVASIVVVPLSVGRAGWLGLVTAGMAYEALAGFPHLRAAGARRQVLAAGGLIGGLLVVGVALNLDRIGAGLASNLESRLPVWQQAAGIFLADPVSGSGPGTFSWARLIHVPDFTDPIGVILAHNAWLQTLADGGLLLGLGIGAVVVLWLRTTWRQRTAMTAGHRMAAAAVTGLGVSALLDDVSFLPALTAMAVTLAAWSAPAAPRTTSAGRWHPRALAVVGAASAIGVTAVLSSVAVESARLAAAEGRSAAVDGRWEEAADAFRAAVDRHGTNPHHHLALALAHAELGQVESARLSYERARDASPGDPRTSGGIAAIGGLLGGAAAELEPLQDAVRHSTDAQYALRLGNALLLVGREADATKAYALAVLLRSDIYPTLPQEERLAVLEVIADRAVVFEADDRSERALLDAGLADGSLTADAPPAWTAIGAAVEGDSREAGVLIAEARQGAAHDQLTHLAAAAVARFACDEAAYDRALDLAGRILGAPVPRLAIGRDPIYREPGLGDYQPSWVTRPPAAQPWPFSLVEEPSCPWTP